MISRSEPVLRAIQQLRDWKRCAERGEARIRFLLERRTRTTVLSGEQVERFEREGYLLASGLIPDEVVRGAAAAIWERLGASPDRPESWIRIGPDPKVIRDRRFGAVYSDSVLAAAAQLSGDDVASFLRPSAAYTINSLPRTGEWRHHTPHLDHSNVDARHRSLPRPFRIGTITYFTDVRPQGGGTVVWPGSHRKLEALARSDPERYEFLPRLNADLSRIDLGPLLELTPSRGDVLFQHPLLVHSASENLSGSPRLAVGYKW